ncbi:MAG: hypothetical protein HY423_05205 [Candidatus Lambdaproteobacteria bacterium]|nr:hypothetical protein [Candidatus Lambdaproteobacteria bacterium]
MSASPARIHTLGPEGTFSDQAAQRLRAHLRATEGRPELPVLYTRTIPEVLLRAVAEPGALGVFPIENSANGTVVPAQDSLVRHRVTILWEIALAVRFSLLARGPLDQVRTYFAHPQAFDQCSEFLATRLPQGQVLFANSNADAGRRFLATLDVDTAAIVPIEFGAEHRQWLAAEQIQDYAHNTTRFLAVRKALAEERFDYARRKTSLLIEPDEDRPGLLHELLAIFHRYGLNLCRLESRPDKIRPWNYVFYIDFNNNPDSARCIADLRATRNRITVLGSYDPLP